MVVFLFPSVIWAKILLIGVQLCMILGVYICCITYRWENPIVGTRNFIHMTSTRDYLEYLKIPSTPFTRPS